MCFFYFCFENGQEMNKTVELVNEWGAFEEKYPDRSIEDFCRHYLVRKREEKGVVAGGIKAIRTDGLLLRIIGRIAKLNIIYCNIALEGTGVVQIEEFGMLITIQQNKNPRKSEIIQANIQEVSSGTDMLTRLLKRGLIKEMNDVVDKRSKRVELTADGKKAVAACMVRVGKLAKMMLNDMPEDDKQLCIQLLKDVEIKYSSLWLQHKGKPFDEIYASMMTKAGPL
jgi:DNA-binding MarR family transcriptional regulator